PLPEPVVPPPPAAATPSPAVPPVGGTPAWPPDRRERSTLPEERPNRGLRNDRYMPPTLSPGPAPSPGAPPILSPVPGRSEAAPDDGRPTMLAAHSAAGAAAALRTGRAMRLATVGFGSGSARLDRGDRAAIDQIASIHRRRGGLVVVVGHASREAGDARLLHERIANLNVSLDRANAVARALQQAGVPADSIRVEARGDSEPAVAATTAAAEAANRRVEIFIDF
ncbi:MAG: OmpA family protein, partial [Rhodospirillaceae bacterium]